MSRSTTRKASKITKGKAIISTKDGRIPEGLRSLVFGKTKEFAICDTDNLQEKPANKPRRVSKRKHKNRALTKLRDKNQFLVSEAARLNATLTIKNNEISKLYRDVVQTRFNLAEVNNETEAFEEECSTIEFDLMAIEDMINDKGLGYKLDKSNLPMITNSRLLAFGEESYNRS